MNAFAAASGAITEESTWSTGSIGLVPTATSVASRPALSEAATAAWPAASESTTTAATKTTTPATAGSTKSGTTCARSATWSTGSWTARTTRAEFTGPATWSQVADIGPLLRRHIVLPGLQSAAQASAHEKGFVSTVGCWRRSHIAPSRRSHGCFDLRVQLILSRVRLTGLR